MALEGILKGNEPEDVDGIEFDLDLESVTETESESADEQDAIDLDDDDSFLGSDDTASDTDEEPEPPKAKKADDGKVPRAVLVAERKKRQAEIEALKAQIEALKTAGLSSLAGDKSAELKQQMADAGYSDLTDPVMKLVDERTRPLLAKTQELEFELFAKDMPEAREYKDAVIQFAGAKNMDYKTAYYALFGEQKSLKTKDDLEREINARVEQRLKEAGQAGKVSFTAGGSATAAGTKKAGGSALSVAQQQIAKKAGMDTKIYSKFTKSLSWDEGRSLTQKK